MTTVAAHDTIELKLLSFGFDKSQTQFLEHRVYNQHPEPLRKLYDRVRYHIKTVSLNDNIDIDIDLKVGANKTTEYNRITAGGYPVMAFRTVNRIMPEIVAKTFDSFEVAGVLATMLSRQGSDKFYGTVNDELPQTIDLQGVKKIISDFIIDMDQFGVKWLTRQISHEDPNLPKGVALDLVKDGIVVLELEIFNPGNNLNTNTAVN